jgi:hypothetical protein
MREVCAHGEHADQVPRQKQEEEKADPQREERGRALELRHPSRRLTAAPLPRDFPGEKNQQDDDREVDGAHHTSIFARWRPASFHEPRQKVRGRDADERRDTGASEKEHRIASGARSRGEQNGRHDLRPRDHDESHGENDRQGAHAGGESVPQRGRGRQVRLPGRRVDAKNTSMLRAGCGSPISKSAPFTPTSRTSRR